MKGVSLGSPLAAASPGSSGGAVAGPLTYYLTVGGLDGEVTTPGHVGAFAVSHFSFEASRTGDAVRASAVPGRLVVDLARDADLTGFLRAITEKSPGRLVRLTGVIEFARRRAHRLRPAPGRRFCQQGHGLRAGSIMWS